MKHIPVTIWGSLYGNGDRQIPCASPFPYGDPRFHMGIMSHGSPLPYGDPRMVTGTHYHMGTRSVTNPLPYGDCFNLGILEKIPKW